MSVNRKHNRRFDQLRDIRVKYDPFGYSHGSVFFEQGGTKVYVSISIQQGVPKFLKGTGNGWLTAEYTMHPHSSDQGRMQRELSSFNRNFRSVEISRLVGRCMRSVVDLNKLGEKTIYIDCDVLQADGGTRTACITAASLAIEKAQDYWLEKSLIRKKIVKHKVAAVSAGIVEGRSLLDLDKDEDCSCDGDFNFVVTESGMIVEVQGTSEQYPLAWVHFDELRDLACKGVTDIFKAVNN